MVNENVQDLNTVLLNIKKQINQSSNHIIELGFLILAWLYISI